MPSTQYSTRSASKDNLADNLGPLDGFPCTPSDSNDLPAYPGQAVVGLYCGSAGTIAVNLFGGGTATLTIPGQGIHLIGAQRVLATGTTVSPIATLYTPI